MNWKWLVILAAVLVPVAAGQAKPAIRVKELSDIRYSREAASFRVEVVPQAGLAVVYDGGSAQRRLRVLTADGRITELSGGRIGNVLFDKFVWNEAERRLYSLAGTGLSFYQPSAREFLALRTGPDFLRDIIYVPWLRTTIVSGQNGLYRIGPDGTHLLKTGGPRLHDVVRVVTLPRYRALFVETID